jgi:CheY-like chemotaxis protein
LEQRLRGQAGVEASPGQTAVDAPVVNDELAWLKGTLPESGVDLQDALPAVLDLSRPLADRYGVRLEITWADALPNLAVHPVALRQILLNLLGMAIHRAAGGRVCISVRPLQWEVRVRVQSVGGETAGTAQASSTRGGPSHSGLDMTDRLVSLCAGRLDLLEDEDGFAAALTLPAHERLPVLVIDDNTDALQLLKRYALGTRYRLIGTRDPEQALDLAEKLSPQIVVLDVMMPEVDGWVVLGQLRQHPLTSHVPIVVCTILAQEELALSLGASDFVHKPVTRQSFLAALDRQVTRMGIKPR